MWLLFEAGIIFSRLLLKKTAGGEPGGDNDGNAGGNGSGGSGGGSGSGVAAAAATGTAAAVANESIVAAVESDQSRGDFDPNACEDYEPPSDEDLDAELDQLEAEEAQSDADEPDGNANKHT
jgi:sec-independent protein translocase protein TatC